MTVERLVFPQTVEGLFVRGLARVMTPELEQRLREEGLDLAKPLAQIYFAKDTVHWTKVAARVLYPQLSDVDAHKMMGRHLLEGYFDTLMGKALAPLLRVIGPRRAIERMERNFRTGTNYMEIAVEKSDANEVVLRFADAHGMPGYYAGCMEAGAALTRARNLRVEMVALEDPAYRYHVRWDD